MMNLFGFFVGLSLVGMLAHFNLLRFVGINIKHEHADSLMFFVLLTVFIFFFLCMLIWETTVERINIKGGDKNGSDRNKV